MASTDPRTQIQDAITFLAGRCDGANSRDGCGFNGRDTEFGHSLADQIAAGRSLSQRQLAAALRVARTYAKTQLTPAGYDIPTQDVLDAYLANRCKKVSEPVTTPAAPVKSGVTIQYVSGDASRPNLVDGWNIVAQVNNNVGGWGAGFVLAVSRECPAAEAAYRDWHANKTHKTATGRFGLGEYQLVAGTKTETNQIFWCNIIGQVAPGRYENGKPPIRYEAVRAALAHLGERLVKAGKPVHVHCPTMGAGLAGGKWDEIAKIIQEELCDRGVPVTVYKFKKAAAPRVNDDELF